MEVLMRPKPELLPDVVVRNRQCRWKEGSVHVPNCKSFLVTETERKHVKRSARLQQHRDASCHQVFFFFPARQGIHSEHLILIAFPLQQCCTNISQCCVSRTLPAYNVTH